MAGSCDIDVKYEQSDVASWLVACLAAGTAAFVILSPLVLWLLVPESMHGNVAVGNLSRLPAPRLQLDPRRDLTLLRTAEDQRLSSYGWINRDRKTVHIPIEHALALTLKRGLTGWPKP